MNNSAKDEQAETKTFRTAFSERDEAMVNAFAAQFAIDREDAGKYLERADWDYLRAFDALLVSVRTADETDQTAKTLEAILTPPTAAEIQRHTELGDKTVCGDCQDEGRASTEAPFQLIEHLIIKHGGDCCGCAVSKQDGEIVC